MKPAVLLDAGPLIALLDRDDTHHAWAREMFSAIDGELLTCEAVLAETFYLLRHVRGGSAAIFHLLADGSLVLSFQLDREFHAVEKIMAKYSDLPASLADACLVRMAETHHNATILTLDRHFTIYRRSDRRVIPLLHPRW